MPELVLKRTGKPVFVPADGVADAVASGLYEAPSDDTTVEVQLPSGETGQMSLADLKRSQTSGAAPESEASFRGREREARIERERGGVIGTGQALLMNAADEVSLGGLSAVGRLVSGDDYTEARKEVDEANPYASIAGKAAGIGVSLAAGGSGALGKAARFTPLGKVTALGSKIAKAPLGAGLGEKFGRAALGGTFEGAAAGAGTGIQEVALSDDPITMERVASSLSSNMLYGAGIGGAAGTLGKAAEIGLARTRTALDAIADRAGARAGIADDLAQMDSKALREAKRAELEVIEQSRAPLKSELADDIGVFRKEIRDQKVWLATKGSKDAEVRAITKRMIKTERALDNVLDDPKYLAENPKGALSALRRQEAALDELITKHGESVRATFATDTSGTRAASLDAVPKMLERNRGLQAKIAELTGTPTSARLTEIEDAVAGLASGGPRKGLGEQMAGGAVFGLVADAARMLPGGGFIAPFLGAKAADMVGSRVFGRFAKSAAEASKRASQAVGKFLDVAQRVTPVAPVLATKVLSSVRFAQQRDKEDATVGTTTKLADAYRARSSEIRESVAMTMEGKFQMRPEARKVVADQLKPVGAMRPDIADMLETIAARRMEFLAGKLPRRPELAGLQTGPDTWQPSEMEMRTFARYVAAVEDPAGIVERLAGGTVTPEDKEAMQEVYPEIYADIQRQIIEQLPTLRSQLPYQKRLAFSIFSGVPVDPAMDPRILQVLQAQYVDEPDTEGGTQGPLPKAQFGSVRAEKATPAQERAR